jgi:flagellar motor switch protein FliN
MRLLALILFPILLSAQTTYYVSQSGSASNTGTSIGSPWNWEKVMSFDFSTSDTILFNRGDTIYGEISKNLWDPGYEGTAEAHFYIGAYGTGAKPIFMMDCSNLVWTARAGYDSVYAARMGPTYACIGWEHTSGNNTGGKFMTNYSWSIRTSLDDPDSLDKYLKSLTASSFGPAHRETVNGDTVYVKTHDGNPPKVYILRQNFIRGNYLTIQNIDFRNGYHALNLYPLNHGRLVNLYCRNFVGIAFMLANFSSYNAIDSCRADSSCYTPFYSWYGQRNIFSYDSVFTVQDTNGMGIVSSIEQGGFGFERDTGSVLQYSYIEDADGGVDAFYNAYDTVRYTVVRNCIGGIWLNGDRWVAHNNDIQTTTSSDGISIQIVRYTTTWNTDGGGLTSGAGQTHVYDNIIDTGPQGAGIDFTSNVAQGTLLAERNIVIGDHTKTTLMFLQKSGATTRNNAFIGLGRFSDTTWAGQRFYSTLSAFQDATVYEDGSTGIGDFYIRPTITGSGTLTPAYPIAVDSNASYTFTSATPVTMTVELGRTKIPIKHILQLAQGSVIELDALAGEPMDVLVNGCLIAQGEVVVVNEKFGIRLTDIVTPSERMRRLNR